MVKLFFTWHAAVVAGYQKYAEELAKFRDLEVTLLIPEAWWEGNKRVPAEKTCDPTYRIIPGKTNSDRDGLVFRYRGMGQYIKETQPDVIFIYEEPWARVTRQILLNKLIYAPRAKTVFYTYQNIFTRYAWPYNAIEWFTHRAADGAIAASLEIKEVLDKKKFSRPVKIIPPGFDPRVFKPEDCSDLKERLGLNYFTIGYAGRLVPEKGIDNLFRACAGLNGIDLLLIGGGPEKEKLKALAEQLALRTVWVDAVPQIEMVRYFNLFDLLVLPSLTTPGWKEQFGRVLIEAMACRVPVLGSDSGEIPNVIGDAELLFKEGNVEDLRGKIKRMLEDKTWREEKREAGYRRAQQNFTWAKAASDTYHFFQELLQ